jgi:hypothetical protein
MSSNKKRLNWWEYWIGHCWMTGWQSIGMTFNIWFDLMTNNFEKYALLTEDDAQEECLDWFWASIVEDDVYEKEFLEYLAELADDAQKHPENLIPFDLDKELEELEELINE